MPRSLPPAHPVNRVTEQAAQTEHASDQCSCAAADVRDGRPTHYSADVSAPEIVPVNTFFDWFGVYGSS